MPESLKIKKTCLTMFSSKKEKKALLLIDPRWGISQIRGRFPPRTPLSAVHCKYGPLSPWILPSRHPQTRSHSWPCWCSWFASAQFPARFQPIEASVRGLQ